MSADATTKDRDAGLPSHEFDPERTTAGPSSAGPTPCGPKVRSSTATSVSIKNEPKEPSQNFVCAELISCYGL